MLQVQRPDSRMSWNAAGLENLSGMDPNHRPNLTSFSV